MAIVVGLLAAAGIGLGAGVLISDDSSAGSTTALVPVTVSLPGETVVTVQTSTLPAVTVVQTATEILTETLTTVQTVVTTVPPTVSIG